MTLRAGGGGVIPDTNEGFYLRCWETSPPLDFYKAWLSHRTLCCQNAHRGQSIISWKFSYKLEMKRHPGGIFIFSPEVIGSKSHSRGNKRPGLCGRSGAAGKRWLAHQRLEKGPSAGRGAAPIPPPRLQTWTFDSRGQQRPSPLASPAAVNVCKASAFKRPPPRICPLLSLPSGVWTNSTYLRVKERF